MTEQTGSVRALEVLGDKINELEAALRHVMNQRDDLKREADELEQKNAELTEKLKQANRDLEHACSYALKLENLLEGCKAVYNDMKAGGADKCKKS